MKASLIIFNILKLIVAVRCIESRRLRTKTTSLKVKRALTSVPAWIRDYVKWHKQTRETSLHNPNTKFLVVTCHRDYACGGLSDRLRTIPYFLLAAYKTNRLLMIKWQKFNLEDFLLPPHGGLDWRLPEDVEIDTKPWNQRSCADIQNTTCEFWEHTEERVAGKKNIFINARTDLYGELKEKYFVSALKPDGVFSDIMKILFRPRAALQEQLVDTMHALGLRPGAYIAAHYRDRYPYLLDRSAKMTLEHKQELLHNSIDCVVHKYGSKEKKVYFTSDNSYNVQYLLHRSPYAVINSTVEVVGIDEMMRENIDEGIDYDTRSPEEFYPVFIDMFLLAHSECVSYGQGGYGLFGSRLSGEKCAIQHQVLWNKTVCPSALEVLPE